MSGTKSDIEILMVPGWGFGAEIWDVWDAFLSPNYPNNKFDPGYYGPKKEAAFSGLHNRLNVIFSHSYGLHRLSPDLLKQTDLLVIFGGFLQFHPVAAQYRKRSKLIVRQMILKLEEKPQQVVNSFIENCYYPETSNQSFDLRQLNTDRLIKDLKRLNTEKLNIEIMNYVSKVCILHGGEDAIVPKAKGRELYDKLPVKAYYYEIQQAGHALPFTHTHLCWSLIKPIIEQFDNL
jgi:pimeloyl-[acyl-carrier protein] methyl ester esterase